MGASFHSFPVEGKLVVLALVLITFLSSFYGSQFIELKSKVSAGGQEPVKILHRSLKQDHPQNIKLEPGIIESKSSNLQNIKLDPGIESRSSSSKFMLVTGERSTPCGTSQGSFILMKSYKNKVDYCSLHGCSVWYTLESWNPGFRGTWARYPLLKDLMVLNPQVEWFLWMDGDAIFTDLEFRIPFDDYRKRDLVVPGYPDKVYGENPDWVGLNAGVFLIRNSDWSRNFLESWMELNQESAAARINAEIPSRPQSWGPDDQSALVYLLRKLPAPDRERTYLELRYVLHGYWEQLVDTYEGLSSSSKPFVTHFCGCSFCGNEVSPRCISGFARAFNFADDQLLARAGLRHLNLSSTEVVKVVKIQKQTLSQDSV